MRVLLLLVLAATTACGGRIAPEDTNAGDGPGADGVADPAATPTPAPSGDRLPTAEASELLVPDDRYCARASRSDSLSSDLRPRGRSEDVAVAELSVAQECTGLGGDYLLARDLHASTKYWLGGHGCSSTKALAGLTSTFGVVRYARTSSELTLPVNACVSFPGDDPKQPSTTRTKVRAVGVFATQRDAEAFAASLRR